MNHLIILNEVTLLTVSPKIHLVHMSWDIISYTLDDLSKHVHSLLYGALGIHDLLQQGIVSAYPGVKKGWVDTCQKFWYQLQTCSLSLHISKHAMMGNVSRHGRFGFEDQISLINLNKKCLSDFWRRLL